MKKLLLIGFLLIIVIAIPLTIFLVQQQLLTRSEATPNTTLSFTPGTQSANVGDNVEFNILISPGTNQVSYVKLVIKFDPTKLNISEEDFTVNTASGLSILQGPVVGTDTISVALSIGSDPTNVIKTDTDIGSLIFNVVGSSALPTDITFDSTTEIRSVSGESDAYNENVFLSGTPGSVTILGDGEVISPTPEANISTSPTPEASVSSTPTTLSEIPTCSIGLDVSNTGIAPYTINFTASGTDIDGTIESVSFDFGDGNNEDITSGGGISTDSVEIIQAHTYETPGEYIANVIMTDDTGETNDTNSCTASITITDDYGNTTVDNTDTTDTTSPTPEETYNELTPTLAPTGPTDAIVGIGALGGVLFLIGALLFFAL